MDELLINAYAHSNLHEALLAHLYAEIIAREPDLRRALSEFRNDVSHHLKDATFPAEDPDSPKVQQRSLEAANRFFQSVELILTKPGKTNRIL